jgi:hypothetical protein
MLLRTSSSSVARKELASTLGDLLGPPGEFYRLLHADAMRQEELVARALAASRRLLTGQRGGTPEEREYIGKCLDRALQCFGQQDWASAVTGMHRAASQATRSLASGPRGAALLAGRSPDFGASLRVERKVGLLLEASDRLRLSFGFLSGLHADSHHRSLHPEEALLGVYALRQVVDELTQLGRRPPSPAARPNGN